MNSTNGTLTKTETITAKGRWGKYAGIALIAISIVGLVVTPKSMLWLILLEGVTGITGIALFVYSRIKFWRGVNKLRGWKLRELIVKFNPDFAVGIVARRRKPWRNVQLEWFYDEGISIDMLRSKIVKQALQQGFSSRSRWLLQILGLVFFNWYKTWIVVEKRKTYNCGTTRSFMKRSRKHETTEDTEK